MAPHVKGLVSLPYNYGVAGRSKPYCKMAIHAWSDNGQAIKDLRSLQLINRWAYEVNIQIVDIDDKADLTHIDDLFIIIQEVVLADNEREGTSWYCEKAFMLKTKAEQYAKEMEKKGHGFFWVSEESRLKP
jgi:hypothetical protein